LKLPNEIISALTVNRFKNRYNKHFDLLNKKEIATLAGFRAFKSLVDDL
jgi:hypothetical protein